MDSTEHINNSQSNNSTDDHTIGLPLSPTLPGSVGVRVKLIDFGRSLSVMQSDTTTTLDNSCVGKSSNSSASSAQLATLVKLYQPIVTETANAASNNKSNESAPVVVYSGDISAKGYKCAEMEQGQPWSYQVRKYFLTFCNCRKSHHYYNYTHYILES